MGFLGVYTAIYDYAPLGEGELAMSEGDVLYILEKGSDDGWWKAKKKAAAEDEEEPVGLIPNNYIEEAPIISHARAIYEYTRQTDEELSFSEEDILQVFDTSDPDWILVGFDGEYGFVPSNYINMQETAISQDDVASVAPPALPTRPQSLITPKDVSPRSLSSPANPAPTLAGSMQNRVRAPPELPVSSPRSRSSRQASQPSEYRMPDIPNSSQDVPPSKLSSRSRSDDTGDQSSDTLGTREASQMEENMRTPGGFHMYNINEMVSVMGKKKKMPTTLGINLATGTILIVPESAEDEAPQEWSANKMTHYSREGKHVFMELVRPSKSIDFHAGAKDTAEEIVAALAELAGAARAEGLREVILAGSQSKQRKGQVVYDFIAQGDDEVTVAIGDDVVILDDSKSDEWWKVRRLKNGKEGVVPSTYIEVTGTVTVSPSGGSGPDQTRATVEHNRLEEIRLTKEAIKASKEPQQVRNEASLPERGSSLSAGDHGNNLRQQRSKRENGRSSDAGNLSKSKSRPDSSKVRTWTDRSGSFSVEAQLLGLKDGKIHLHKMNGVKIAVPIAKMSREDLEYVEGVTGISLDDEKPLADVKRAKASDKQRPAVELGVSVNKNVKPEYDWFQFFLSCDVPVGLCERYAQAFTKDSMDESVLPDVNATILRTLGLREGDIIKVMRALDAKYSRERSVQENDSQQGGLFSGPGGALRNNTRKGRPAPTVHTSDVVDAAAFSKGDAMASGTDKESSASLSRDSPAASRKQEGFDDNAWDVKPISKKTTTQQATSPKRSNTVSPVESASSSQPKVIPAMTGSMKDLSLLTEPLQPSKPGASATSALDSPIASHGTPQSQPPPGATPSFFTAIPSSDQSTTLNSTSTSSPKSMPRQRPAPPPTSHAHGSLVPPPPAAPKALPAPQLTQSSFLMSPNLNTQMTGTVQGQIAPPGQSLGDIAQARLQQQYTAHFQPLRPAVTGYVGLQGQNVAPFPASIPHQQQYIYPMMTGTQGASPFADTNATVYLPNIQAQQTGFSGPYLPTAQTMPHNFNSGSNLNNFLPQALEPQRTSVPAIQSGQTGPHIAYTQPLQPQKTGPPPPVRFGTLPDTKKLISQQTGRRANLSQATPDNPFGF